MPIFYLGQKFNYDTRWEIILPRLIQTKPDSFYSNPDNSVVATGQIAKKMRNHDPNQISVKQDIGKIFSPESEVNIDSGVEIIESMKKANLPQNGQSLTLIVNLEDILNTSSIVEIDVQEACNTNVNR